MANSKSTPAPSANVVMHSPDLTVEQYKTVLETIASTADTLSNLLIMLQQGSVRDWQDVTVINAAQHIACRIGAMSDTAVNPRGEVVGDANHWNYGPNFATAGKGA